jgi:two-component system, OmpR family, sensor kinase
MSIRARIVILSTALMAVVLVSVSLGVYQMLMRSLESEMQTRLYSVVDSYRQQSHIEVMASGEQVLRAPGNLESFTYPGLYIQVTDRAGVPRGQAPERDSKLIEIPESVVERNSAGDAVYYTTEFATGRVRVFSAPLRGEDGALFGTVQVFESLGPMEQALDQLKLFLITGSAIGLTMTAIGSYLLAGQSLAPLVHITAAARRIGQSRDLKHQIRTPDTSDEVQQLAETFNHMLARLDSAFHAERRFVSDASHELRTPLTALRGNAEILLRQIDGMRIDPDDLREGLTDIRDEAERMGRLVENLLTLARADVGWRPELYGVDLDQVAVDAARVAIPLSAQHQFDIEIEPDLQVQGDPDQLKQLILILLDNAFTYTPEGGRVVLRAARAGSEAQITVQDQGPGMPEAQVRRIFDRFYRGDAARNQRSSGAGLGLAIARWITDCHAGTIAADSQPDRGTVVTVSIPLAVPLPAEQVAERLPQQPASALSDNV